MKGNFILSLFGLVSGLSLQAGTMDDMMGVFIEPTSTFIVGYETEQACVKDGGEWIDDLCIFAAENRVELKSDGGIAMISAETIGSNAHMCSFEGPVSEWNGTTALSRVDADVWDGSTWKPGMCEVKLHFISQDEVSLESNGCQNFCGARAWLSVDKATRKSK